MKTRAVPTDGHRYFCSSASCRGMRIRCVVRNRLEAEHVSVYPSKLAGHLPLPVQHFGRCYPRSLGHSGTGAEQLKLVSITSWTCCSDSAPLRAPRAGRRLHNWARCAQWYRSYDYKYRIDLIGQTSYVRTKPIFSHTAVPPTCTTSTSIIFFFFFYPPANGEK